jgi:Domain of unknown function (DUF4232)
MPTRRSLVATLASAALLAGTGVALAGSVPSGAAAVPRCRASHIVVSTGQSQGAAGTFYVPIIFTNRGAACALWGVPAAQPVNAARHAVGPPSRNDSAGQMPARHVVARGGSVSSAFGYADTGNYPPNLCHARAAWGLRVSLGTFAGPTYVPLKMTVCTSRASTHVQLVVPGRTGVATS